MHLVGCIHNYITIHERPVYVSRSAVHSAVLVVTVLLHDANKTSQIIRVSINCFSLPIEFKSHPLTCKCIQHLALAVQQVTPPATKLEPTVRTVPFSTAVHCLQSVRQYQFAFPVTIHSLILHKVSCFVFFSVMGYSAINKNIL